MTIHGRRWNPPSRWWGRGADGAALELDLVAEAVDGGTILVGEAKRTCSAKEASAALLELEGKAARVPELEGRKVVPVVFALRKKGSLGQANVVGAAEVLASLR
ncbi:MAG: hypothetical protein AB7S26_29285 [Sandaracinaceae bacterium]